MFTDVIADDLKYAANFFKRQSLLDFKSVEDLHFGPQNFLTPDDYKIWDGYMKRREVPPQGRFACLWMKTGERLWYAKDLPLRKEVIFGEKVAKDEAPTKSWSFGEALAARKAQKIFETQAAHDLWEVFRKNRITPPQGLFVERNTDKGVVIAVNEELSDRLRVTRSDEKSTIDNTRFTIEKKIGPMVEVPAPTVEVPAPIGKAPATIMAKKTEPLRYRFFEAGSKAESAIRHAFKETKRIATPAGTFVKSSAKRAFHWTVTWIKKHQI